MSEHWAPACVSEGIGRPRKAVLQLEEKKNGMTWEGTPTIVGWGPERLPRVRPQLNPCLLPSTPPIDGPQASCIAGHALKWKMSDGFSIFLTCFLMLLLGRSRALAGARLKC